MRSTRIASILFLASVLFVACNTDSFDDVEKGNFNTLAEDFLASNPDSTILLAQQSLQLNPDAEQDFYSHFLIGLAYHHKKEYKQASVSFMQAAKLTPADEEYDLYRYKILYNLGWITKVYSNYDLSASYYEQALAYAPEDKKSRLHYNLGNAYRRNNMSKKATIAYLKSADYAYELDDHLRYLKAMHQLGAVYETVDDLPKAREEYQKILDDEPLEGTSYTNLIAKVLHNMGNTYQQEQDYRNALPYYHQSLNLKKKESDRFITLMDMGTCYQELGQYDSAILYLAEAEQYFDLVSPSKDNIKVFYMLDLSYRKAGMHEQSLQASTTFYAKNDAFIEVKEALLEQYSAADIENTINGYHKDTSYAETLEKYALYIWIALAFTVLLAIYLVFIRKRLNKTINAYKKTKRNEEGLRRIGDDFIHSVENLSRKS
ncbi:MAG: tetratricopeptide repeat protein [Cyclobacteriaceae bacterium]